MNRLVALTAVATTAAALVLSVSPASATYAGENGRIAFRRYLNDEQTRAAIFTIRPGGKLIRQVTYPDRGVLHTEPDWSPNGRWLAYTRVWRGSFLIGPHAEGHPNHILRIRRDGSHRDDLSTSVCPPDTCEGDEIPAWSRNGRWIAFSRSYPSGEWEPSLGISLMRANGTRFGEVTRPALRFHDVGPTWSPDGTRLVFVRNVAATCGCRHADDHAIFIVRRDGSHLRRITPWKLQGSLNPDWSPNGSWILFTSVGAIHPPSRGLNVWMIHPSGTGLRRITNNPDDKFTWYSSTFSPDGTKIVTSRSPGLGKAGNADVYVMNLDGSGLRNITRSPRWESASDWGPRPE